MGRFSRSRRSGLALRVDAAEAALLRSLLGEVLSLLGPQAEESDDPLAAAVGIGTATSAPEDPVLARLLPDAYAGDPEAAGEFRRYTEQGLRDRKRRDARAALATLDGAPGAVPLDEAAARAWLGALNDLRLALGTRLGVSDDPADDPDDDLADEPAGPADARAYARAVYDYLTWLQETLVQALARRS